MTQTHHDPMVSSQDVTGTSVYSATGEHVGDVHHLLIDKKSGQVAYVMMSFGGFLGMGKEEYPIPWKSLRYDANRKGFVTEISRDKLQGAPRPTGDWRADRDWHARNYHYYGISPYWY